MIQVVVNMVNWHSHINPSQIIQKVQIVCACLYSKGTLLKPNKFQPIFDLMNFKSSWTRDSPLFLFTLERTYVILTLNLCLSGKILVVKCIGVQFCLLEVWIGQKTLTPMFPVAIIFILNYNL